MTAFSSSSSRATAHDGVGVGASGGQPYEIRSLVSVLQSDEFRRFGLRRQRYEIHTFETSRHDRTKSVRCSAKGFAAAAAGGLLKSEPSLRAKLEEDRVRSGFTASSVWLPSFRLLSHAINPEDDMHKLMVGVMTLALGFAVLPPAPASAQGWHGTPRHHGWHNRGWHGHRHGWRHHQRCRTHWVNGRRVTRCW